jgi:hypothetical protein
MTYPIRAHLPPPDPVSIERMAAADLILIARQAKTRAPRMSIEERDSYVKRCKELIVELEAAVSEFERGAPDLTWIPPHIRLLPDSEARVHE